jgi:tRNA 2-selenouridine synthase
VAKRVDIEELLQELENRPLVDVRTPAEYERGHIPGAHNMPLFSNEERAIVGTTYKQVGTEEALLEGLDFVGPKMRAFVEEARRLAPDGKIAVHCWRGGKRSDSIGWLLEFAGFDVIALEGGYKAFRRHILQWFEQTQLPLIILGGPTGTGKTEMLHEIARRGEQVIDLEGLAHHKGSAFGALGEAPQPTTEHFENKLYRAFKQLDTGRRIWLENESRTIGKACLPDGLWTQMRNAPLIHVEIPTDLRLERLVKDYAQYSDEALIHSFECIRKRLGGQHLKAAIEAIGRKDYAEAAAVALRYYDKTYAYGLENRAGKAVYHLEIDQNDPASAAGRVLSFIEKQMIVPNRAF